MLNAAVESAKRVYNVYMPEGTNYLSAPERVSYADATGENAASSSIDSTFLPYMDLTTPGTSQDFINQSQQIAQQSFAGSGIPGAFDRLRQSGRRAAGALSIIDQQYVDEEMAKYPFDDMQDEVDQLLMQRARVLPDILADPTIIDYKAKVKIAGKIQNMFDSEADQILDKKEELEKKAESRAKTKVAELKARADILNLQYEQDKFELGKRIDLFKSGQGTLQDILESAVSMDEKSKKKSKEEGDNPFAGGYSKQMVRWFKYFEATGQIPFSLSGDNEKAQFIALHDQWNMDNRPGEFEVVPREASQLEGDLSVYGSPIGYIPHTPIDPRNLVPGMGEPVFSTKGAEIGASYQHFVDERKDKKGGIDFSDPEAVAAWLATQ